jgi:predicted SAM-dependent methyltransferase
MIVLNVGGGSNNSLPGHYAGWDQHVLDIDPAVSPDILCDARRMENTVQPEGYDAVYCSHNLEHFYKHEVGSVLRGFLRVLKPDGRADIVVPHFGKLVEAMSFNRLDVNDVWYRTPHGEAITFHDVLFGHHASMVGGNEFYAHKCAFTYETLGRALVNAGFMGSHIWEDPFNLYATAYKGEPPSRPVRWIVQ